MMTAIKDARAALLLAVANTSPGDKGVYVTISDLEALLHPAPPADEEREALRRAIAPILTNALNFPEKLQARMLGQNMGPLIDRVTDALAGFRRPGPPTDDDVREAAATVSANVWTATTDPAPTDYEMGDAFLAAGFRRQGPITSGDDPVPRYAQCDLWQALFGVDTSGEYEAFREEHSYADTWSWLLGQVRRRQGPITDEREWQEGGKHANCYYGEHVCAPTDDEREPSEEVLLYPPPITQAEFENAVYWERVRQIKKGFDAAHDDKHGLDHLLMWSQICAGRGQWIESQGLVQAAREYIARDPQGQISDAMVEDALAMHALAMQAGEGHRAAMRAALEAARDA